jgi:hypothetical protein
MLAAVRHRATVMKGLRFICRGSSVMLFSIKCVVLTARARDRGSPHRLHMTDHDCCALGIGDRTPAIACHRSANEDASRASGPLSGSSQTLGLHSRFDRFHSMSQTNRRARVPTSLNVSGRARARQIVITSPHRSARPQLRHLGACKAMPVEARGQCRTAFSN